MNKGKSRKMSSRTYNKYYAKRGKGYLSYCLWYYQSDDSVVTEHKASLLGKVVLLVLYPFVFIINFIAYGVSGIKDFNSAFIPTIKGKPFSQDVCYPRHENYWKEGVEFIESGKLPDRGEVMNKYNTTGKNYNINKIQINKPKSASQSMLDCITSKSYLVLENKDATPILDESDYVVSFSSDKNTNYGDYLEVSKILADIFDFKPLSKEDWGDV